MVTASLRRSQRHEADQMFAPRGGGRLAKAAIIATYRASVAFPGICRLRDIALPPSAELQSCPVGLFRLSSFLWRSLRPF